MKTTRDVANEIINDLRELYESGGSEGIYDLTEMPFEEYKLFDSALKYLKGKGLITAKWTLSSAHIGLTSAGIDYIEGDGPVQKSEGTTIVNIGNVNAPSVIGSQAHVTQNIGATLAEISDLVASLPKNEQGAMLELLQVLKDIEKDSKPVPKGVFSKFSDALSKHADIFTAVGRFLVKLLMS